MYNKAFLIGNLTRDPELRYTTAGIPVCRFSIAVNRPPIKGQEGNQGVDFLNVVAWRRLGEICGQYLKKGQPVCVEGRLQIRGYEKNGEKKTMTEIILDNMQMLSRRADAAQTLRATAETPTFGATSETEPVGSSPMVMQASSSGEEIPF